ncbi:MAG TPA: CU044_5270 family protein [Solirubrobacteraceae bacterium]|nr:CU044_5270 family protein [Solirubrobacteraceae bacterium]
MQPDGVLPPVLVRFEGQLAAAMRVAESSAAAQRRPRTFLAAILTTAAAAAAVLAFLLATNGPQETSSASAAPLLRAAAAAALRVPSLLPRANQFIYVREIGRVPAGMSTRQGVSVTAVEQIETNRWSSVLRGSVARTRVVRIAFASRRDALLWRENGGQQPGAGHSYRGPSSPWYIFFGTRPGRSGELSRREVLALSGNPRTLLEQTLASTAAARAWLLSLPGFTGGHPSTRTSYSYTYSTTTGPLAANDGFAYSLEAFSSIEDDFLQVTLPARVRSGLYRALAIIPGVRYAGMRRDLVGRVGAEITFDDLQHEVRDELIFDPATSALLGERQVTTHFNVGFPAGTPLEDVAFLNEAVTDSPRIPRSAPKIH